MSLLHSNPISFGKISCGNSSVMWECIIEQLYVIQICYWQKCVNRINTLKLKCPIPVWAKYMWYWNPICGNATSVWTDRSEFVRLLCQSNATFIIISVYWERTMEDSIEVGFQWWNSEVMDSLPFGIMLLYLLQPFRAWKSLKRNVE